MGAVLLYYIGRNASVKQNNMPMSKLEGREAAQVWRVKPPLWFSLLSSSVHSLTDGTVFKEKRLSVVARVFIFRVFVKDTHRLAAVTVSCRPHK